MHIAGLAFALSLIVVSDPTPLQPVKLEERSLDCVDARGLSATCGEFDTPGQHECYAADNFGRCPGDPKCFRPTGEQVICRWPVVKQTDRRRVGVWLDDDGLVRREGR